MKSVKSYTLPLTVIQQSSAVLCFTNSSTGIFLLEEAVAASSFAREGCTKKYDAAAAATDTTEAASTLELLDCCWLCVEEEGREDEATLLFPHVEEGLKFLTTFLNCDLSIVGYFVCYALYYAVCVVRCVLDGASCFKK